jgi:putative DNA primase/helicase
VECPRLEILLKEQQESGLPKDKWEAVMRLFINAGRIALARTFSKQSKKHNYESEGYIDALSIQRPGRKVLCTELSCTRKDIEVYSDTNEGCFGRQKAKINEKGEIVNSPNSKMRLRIEEKERIGFRYKKDGELEVRFNIYAKHILKNYNLLFQDNKKYYLYKSNCWKPISDVKLERVLRFFFDKIEVNIWSSILSYGYKSVLCNECWDMDDVTSAENYINVKNGLLNLTNFKIEPHNYRIFTTNQIPVIYDAEKEHDSKKECPEFLNFLDTIFDDHKPKTKQRLIKFIQEIMGYCLSNSVKAHKFFMFVGNGSNGKSVLCDVLTELAGGVGNVSNVALRNFSKQFAVSQIMNKTLNISTENEVGTNLDTQTLKAIVSGEVMQMEEKFKSPISYRPTAKLVFAVNRLPKTNDKSFGFGRRVICVPFNMRFVEGEPKGELDREADPNLIDKLMKELDGIFAFAIEGLKRLRVRGNGYEFIIPRLIKETIEEYKASNDPYLAFIKECIEADENAIKEVTQKDVQEVFLEWCAQLGHKKERSEAEATRAFMKEFRKTAEYVHIHVIDESHSGNTYYLSGIRFSEKGEELRETVRKRRYTSSNI